MLPENALISRVFWDKGRRRKIRCVYPSDAAQICVSCDSRGTNCVSQEFPDDQTQTPDRRVTQRLGRVEEMLEKLVEKIMPDSYTAGRRHPTSDSPGSATDGDPESVEGPCPFSVGQPPIFEVLSTLRDNGNRAAATGEHHAAGPPTPAPTRCDVILGSKYNSIGKKLNSLFPCQQDIDAIVAASPSASFFVGFFSRYRDLVEGGTEKPSSIADVPPPTSHPMVLAKRLIQLMNCLQQVQPTTPLKLTTREPVSCLMARTVFEVTLVVQNDDLVGYVEGVETLALISLYHSNAGNLRKAWLTLRRALSVAQLMGIDRWGDKPLKSADPMSNLSTRTKAKPLWFRLNFVDRYLSLLLGLPAGTDDNSFINDSVIDEPTDRLEKQHTVVMGAIIKRNSSKGDPAFGATQSIDCDLEAAARSVRSEFWQLPTPESIAEVEPVERMQYMTQLMLQMNHHNLLILLHLPYLLRDPKERRWDYSKVTCMSSSRQLLQTFLLYRKVNQATFACRHTDYGALTAAMTLLLGYLEPKMQARDAATVCKREADRALIEEVRDTLQQMGNDNGDNLSRDASCIIGRLLPLLNPDLMSGGGGSGNEGLAEVRTIHLEIPYLGTININPSSGHPGASGQEVPHAHVSPNASISNSATPTTSTTSASARATSSSTDLEPQDRSKFSTSTPYTHNPNTQATSTTDWSTPSLSQQQQQEASHMLSIPMDYSNDSNGYSDFNGFAPMMQFEWSQAQLAHPELTAEADQWTFQGFDTAYFESLFSSGFHGS